VTTFNLRTVKLRPGEQYSGRQPVRLEPLRFGGETYTPRPDEPEAHLTVTRMSSGTLFELELLGHLEGPCMRCLEAASLDIPVRAREYQADVAESEEMRTPYVVDDRLDLSAWARDAIALSLPEQIVCRDDCKGLCAGCGANLNVEPCRCGPEQADPRWQKLAVLRETLESETAREE
jgi:uncharacterized protein